MGNCLVFPDFNDYYSVKKLVSQDGLSLKYAAPHLKDNYDIVLTAVSQNGQALIFASPRLRTDQTIILRATSSNQQAQQQYVTYNPVSYQNSCSVPVTQVPVQNSCTVPVAQVNPVVHQNIQYIPDVVKQACPHHSNESSITSSRPRVEIYFRSKSCHVSGKLVNINWVCTETGREQTTIVVNRGEELGMDTTPGHRFVVRDCNGNQVFQFTASDAKKQRVVV